MQAVGLPETVVRAWGPEVAGDFAGWLEERLRVAWSPPQIQVSAFVARQKVNVLVLEQVSNLLLAGEPRLVRSPDGGWIWRVPVDLTFPTRGRVGCVGEVDVDARYGEVHYDEAVLTQMTSEARRLTNKFGEPCAWPYQR